MNNDITEALALIREYLDKERQHIREQLNEDGSYIVAAREVDRVIDSVERRCRIIESKNKGA